MNCSHQEEERESVINCAVTCKAYGSSQFLRRDILHFWLLKNPPKLGKTKSSALIRIWLKAYIGVNHTAFGKSPRLYYSAVGREFFIRFVQMI
jgi:hypothetical protein